MLYPPELRAPFTALIPLCQIHHSYARDNFHPQVWLPVHAASRQNHAIAYISKPAHNLLRQDSGNPG